MIGSFGAVLLFVASVSSWQTGWDQGWTSTCPAGYHLYRAQSQHDNGREDRVWNFWCQKTGAVSTAGCSWTGYLNGWDAPLHYICPSGKIITGLGSYHDNHREDRRWKVRCCNQATPLHACAWTGYINDWDGWMDHKIAVNQVITGIYSVHDNGREDRRYKFYVCSKKPVNGNWGGWSAYSACSANCGPRTRTRSCNNPSPINGGAYCSGVSRETAACDQRCSVDVGLSVKVCRAGYEGKPGMCGGKPEDVQPVCTFAAPIGFRNCDWNPKNKKYTCPDAIASKLMCCKYTCITHG